MDDQQIISLFMARSEQAIEESTNKYGTYLTKIAMNILHNTEDASECVNDTWLKAWKNIPPTIPKSLFAFLSTIARNTSFDLYRTKHREKRNSYMEELFSELDETIPHIVSIDKEMESKEIAKELNHFLELQSRDNRVLFVKRYWYGESIKDLALEWHLSESKVTSDLFRMRKKLRDYLEERGVVV